MSKILVDTIDTRSGTSTLTLGSSNAGTIALGSGDVQSNFLQPSFFAYNNASQTGLTNDAYVKVQINVEVYDSDSCYDNSTNYRFTPTVAGKYFVFASAFIRAENGAGNLEVTRVAIYKNGSINNISSKLDFSNNPAVEHAYGISQIVDMNGSSDYIELYVRPSAAAGNVQVKVDGNDRSYFGAYRIGT
tara:strand:- start:1345 stop:1911 length:567 start_codon:yes stop_codon:yes gene_type:complete